MKFLDLNKAISGVKAKYQRKKNQIEEISEAKAFNNADTFNNYKVVIDANCALIDSLLVLAVELSGSGKLPLYDYLTGVDVEAEITEKTMLVVERINREIAFLDNLILWATTSEKFNSIVSC